MSSNLPPALQPAEPGEPIRAAAWNAVVDALRSLVPSGYDLVRGPAGVALVQRARSAAAITMWMKLTVVSGATLKGKLADVNGDVSSDPQAEVTINALVSGSSGLITTGFSFSTCAPKLAVNNIVPVVSMPAAGTTRPAGYWLAWYVTDTCT